MYIFNIIMFVVIIFFIFHYRIIFIKYYIYDHEIILFIELFIPYNYEMGTIQ